MMIWITFTHRQSLSNRMVITNIQITVCPRSDVDISMTEVMTNRVLGSVSA